MSVDLLLLENINIKSAFLDSLMILITKLGNLGMIWIAIGVILIFFNKYRRCGLFMLISLLATFLIGEGLIKNIVCRPRPFIENNNIQLLIEAPLSYSFPSGHSASSFSAAWTIIKFNKVLGILSIALAALIAFSRIYLCVHYPSDVIAGMLLGIIVSQITYTILKKYSKGDVLT